jgi:hypothetical protein
MYTFQGHLIIGVQWVHLAQEERHFEAGTSWQIFMKPEQTRIFPWSLFSDAMILNFYSEIFNDSLLKPKYNFLVLD